MFPAPTAALLHADVDSSPRLVHFSARRGPHHYELSSVQVDTFRANLFCTDPECLGALRARFGVTNEDRAEGGPHFRLEWAPRPAELPEVEYRRLGLQPLWTGAPGEPREVVGTRMGMTLQQLVPHSLWGFPTAQAWLWESGQNATGQRSLLSGGLFREEKH